KIAIACGKPHFDGMIFGQHYAGSLNGFVATARLSNPSEVTVKVASPFAVVSDDKTVDLNLAWKDLDVRLGGLPAMWRRFRLPGRGSACKGMHMPSVCWPGTRAMSALHLRPMPGGRTTRCISMSF